MPINLSGLSEGLGAISDISNFVLVSPNIDKGIQPQNLDGNTVEEILFDYEMENTATISSDITDHFVEDNTTLSDNISIKPEIITVRGVIGELNQLITQVPALARTAIDKLTLIAPYQPELTLTALRAYNIAEQGYRTAINARDNVISTLDTAFGRTNIPEIASGEITAGNEKSQTRQQVFFAKFYGYWRNRTLFTVQTPWAIFKNMAIQDLKAIQGEETNTMSDFQITFKSIRFAKTSFLLDNKVLEGRAVDQSSQVNNIGATSGQQTTRSARGLYAVG